MLSSSMVTDALAGIELVLNRPHVATSPLREQLPTTVVLPLTVTADPAFAPSVVPVGKLIVIWLPATCDNAPVDDVVNDTLYTVLALCAADGTVLSTSTF